MSGAGPEKSEGEPLTPELERMRELGHEVVDRVVERWADLRERPANRPGSREEMEARLREPVPEEGTDAEEALAAFWEDVEPFAGATNSDLAFMCDHVVEGLWGQMLSMAICRPSASKRGCSRTSHQRSNKRWVPR